MLHLGVFITCPLSKNFRQESPLNLGSELQFSDWLERQWPKVTQWVHGSLGI